MLIYCSAHRANHALTGRELEDLVHGLTAALSDAETAPPDERLHADDEPWAFIVGFCPAEAVRNYRDVELYGEHLESMWESRLIRTKVDASPPVAS